MNVEAASDSIELDPRLCNLRGHPDAQAFLGYIFEQQFRMVQSRRIWADACRRMTLSVEFINKDAIAELVLLLNSEPFGYKILFKCLCDEHEMVQCADAAEFLQEFFSKFP